MAPTQKQQRLHPTRASLFQPGFCIYPPSLFFFYDFTTSVTLIFLFIDTFVQQMLVELYFICRALQSLPVPLLQFSKRKKIDDFFSSDQRKKKFLLVVCVSHPQPPVKPAFPLKCLLCALAHTVALRVFFHKIFVALARWFIPLIVLPLSRGSPALLHSVCIGSLTGPGKAELAPGPF